MRLPILVLVVLAAAPFKASACLWDYDTLKQERERFPSALELITGKFLRHSPEFYEWRIKDRQKKLALDQKNPSLYDDLAVAYEKTGQHTKAIETMLAKEAIAPGLYETYSNLGTFHILAGDFKLGLPYIDKALAINPDAHFGREKYQKLLVEYVLSQWSDGKPRFPIRWTRTGSTFYDFLKDRLNGPLTFTETQNAMKGILGMMRFANHDNPLLLEALGDVLGKPGRGALSDAKRLAARCYVAASRHPKAKSEEFRTLAQDVLQEQTIAADDGEQLSLSLLQSDFDTERADADAWYAELKAKELSWIRDGKDADAEFDRLYTQEPEVTRDHDEVFSHRNGGPVTMPEVAETRIDHIVLAVVGLVLAPVLLCFLLYLRSKGRGADGLRG